jgi:hypothetical protein
MKIKINNNVKSQGTVVKFVSTAGFSNWSSEEKLYFHRPGVNSLNID